ncbi:MAG: hypothetical protein GF346_11230, partial [Candidatus Eisenbacteria bacterium]|nr:hypothetical protein [Candidatus Latescibacterota bacterium]MBD3303007.1 hypothetical protein [Candidatus Eisenbacteria bacterium]
MAIPQHQHGSASAPPPTFLLGPAGSGKTALCLERLREHESRGEPALALVPEQTTYLTDRALLEPPGPRAARHVRILSFRRLAHLLEPEVEADRPVLDPAGRRILLRALAGRLPEEIRRPWERLLDRSGFLESLAGLLRDLRFEAGPEGN